MILLEYFDQVSDGIEFVMAFGSLIGLLGLLFSALAYQFTSSRNRGTLYRLIAVSLILISICGLFTGIKYFRI